MCTVNTLETLHMKLAKVLEHQKGFQDTRSYADLVRKIINIFDKGCRLSLEVEKLDQTCVQPRLDKSDVQFSKHELISSSAVA